MPFFNAGKSDQTILDLSHPELSHPELNRYAIASSRKRLSVKDSKEKTTTPIHDGQRIGYRDFYSLVTARYSVMWISTLS